MFHFRSQQETFFNENIPTIE